MSRESISQVRSALGASNLASETESLFAVCTIEDAFAHTGSYIVKSPAGGLVQAVDMFHGSAVPMGVRPIGGYLPKGRVLVYFDAAMEQAIILGGVPRPLGDSRLILPESLVLRSRVGYFEDPMHNSEFNDPKSIMANMSAGRPADCLPGDWGYINEMGVAVYIGKLMTALKASDGAKIEAFMGDDLLRLTGLAYELFTAGLEDHKANDEGEYNEIIRRTPYPWEGLGARAKGVDPTKAASGALKPGGEDTAFEPVQIDQLIVPRQTIFKGYLGDLEREWISAPPAAGGIETFQSVERHQGLAELLKSSDGTLMFRSAKGLIFEKYGLIAVPKQLKAPEDPTGDSLDQGYMPAGEDVQVPEFVWADEDNPMSRVTQLYDYLAWTWGRYTTGGLQKHPKDWDYPEENDLTEPISGGTVYDKSLDKLKTQFYTDLPAYESVKLDHRDGRSDVRYYKSRSMIAQLDDGSIVIEGGCGEQLVMSGGNITLSAPGDVWLRPGRSLIAWAPFDAVIRAGNSAEISAAKKDVRIKADKNLHLLAGNSEENVGGILLESRAEGPNLASDWAQTGERTTSHGIVVKAPKSSFHVMAGDVYIGSDPKESSRSTLCIDAGDEGDLYLRGNQVLASIKQLFGVLSSEGQKRLCAVSQEATIISTPTNLFGGTIITAPFDGSSANVIVGGSLTVHESGLFNQGVITNQGFAARQGAPYIGKINSPIDPGERPAQLAAQIRTQVQEVVRLIERFDQTLIDDAEQGPGNAEFRKDIGFSCRDSILDVKLDQATFVLPETRWQQLLREGPGGAGGDTWEEPVVEAPTGEETMPHPGKQAWKEWSAFGTAGTFKNFDMSAGAAKARDAMDKTGAELEKKTLSSDYKVVKTSE